MDQTSAPAATWVTVSAVPDPTTAEPVPRTATPVASPPKVAAFDLAAVAYADLAKRKRRAAARGLASALAATPGAPNAAAWRAELGTLERRWSGEAYVLVRNGGPTGFGVAPLLGGGQSGGSLAFTPDPLMRRPLAVVVRANAAHSGFGIQNGSLQAALGARWQATPGTSLSIERLTGAREAWVARVAGGASERIGAFRLDAYGEAGVVGARRHDLFASGQARAALALPLGLDAGGGAWASIQHADTRVHRVDVGPTIAWRSGAVTARADWRFRIEGKAAPGSGPALTLSAAF